VTKLLARRRLLTGALAGAAGVLTATALSGCGLLPDGDGAGTPEADPDPLEPLLTAELALVASYDQAIAALPALAARLRPLRADHAAHAQALRARIDPRRADAIPTKAPPGAAASATSSTLAALAKAERVNADGAIKLCLATEGERAALLASIAACESSHLVVLA